MRKAFGATIVAMSFLLVGCQAPDLLLSSSKTTVVRSDDHSRLWQACRAVLARQYDIVQENESNGVIVARGRSNPVVGGREADPTDSRTVTTEINLAILSKGEGYEVRVRAITRGQPGPDFNITQDAGMPQSKESLDFNAMGTAANRDFPLEEQIQSQIQTELSYAPAPLQRAGTRPAPPKPQK